MAADPGSANGDQPVDMGPGGPVGPVAAGAPITPLAVPAAGPAMVSTFGDLFSGAGGKSPVASRYAGRVQEVAAPPLLAPESPELPPGMTESTAVSRSLPGLQTSVTESAFPATIISTPKVFPVNRWDPLAASLLVVLAGLAREGLKAWRRRASQVWPI